MLLCFCVVVFGFYSAAARGFIVMATNYDIDCKILSASSIMRIASFSFSVFSCPKITCLLVIVWDIESEFLTFLKDVMLV